jgi:hypothetical protein
MGYILKRSSTKEEIAKVSKQLQQKATKPLNAKKYSGAVKFEGDPLEIQKKMRDEWR